MTGDEETAAREATLGLLDALVWNADAQGVVSTPPWGHVVEVGTRDYDLHVKYLEVREGARTSMQIHDRKHEVMFFIADGGRVELGDHVIHPWAGLRVDVAPGVPHRVSGPACYVELSTFDAGDDTRRLEDDYGRV